MPAPQKAQLAQLAKNFFIAKMIFLPINWAPTGPQFPDAFDPSELVVAPNSPTNLFREPTLNKYHVDTAKDIGKGFADYIDGISEGICDGIDKWMKGASVAGVIINGPVGVVRPGCVLGPPLAPLVTAKAPMDTPQETKYSNAIAMGLSNAWQAWHMGLSGVISYPAFAAFPGPVGAPTPNVPMPLISFGSPGEAMLSPTTLKGLIEGIFADPQALHASDLFDSITQAFNIVFQQFKATTVMKMVIGTGPIPTFAPPPVLAGPVVMGTGNGAPGACIS